MTADEDLVQNSPEWLYARTGSLGASVIGKAISRLKRSGDRAKEGLDVLYELAAERITGVPAKRVNPRDWGVDHESEARSAYALLTNREILETGIIRHPTIPNAHCSPDALIGDEGGLEIKCPTSAAHLQTLLNDAIPDEHLPQIFWSLACTGRAWWDFVSYDPRFPAQLQFFSKRVHRDDKAIGLLEDEARAFLAELDAKMQALVERYGAWEAA